MGENDYIMLYAANCMFTKLATHKPCNSVYRTNLRLLGTNKLTLHSYVQS